MRVLVARFAPSVSILFFFSNYILINAVFFLWDITKKMKEKNKNKNENRHKKSKNKKIDKKLSIFFSFLSFFHFFLFI